ncbi:UDP-N-acetylmuramoyl-L-alanine--D-glutamate ligase [Rhabdobacter roseus]|uniref:UDP-N-acetylmuramoylalanine--D-glutamate ligase n=1 Tax=Rhabdobacter roseus TaxID=1655419 RepID=A0A840TPG7_9BACT|nr:UDP-N-acetylmuramoyl-L-alanine--D-glutamate ligase [Rhabdobacter roseus]MBB5284805.1 UDP-N-acetylmuramoylalanine--D-glutamate ligase [Rhabdobacter roseus]
MGQKKLVILGGGESGVGTALLAKAKGLDLFLSDGGSLQPKYRQLLEQQGIPFEEGQHSEDQILGAGEVVKSPGIPDNAPLVSKLYQKGIPVVSEIEFASRYTSAKLIAITGSNGKTTTTLLTYHLLRSAGLSVGLAGNIGESFAKQVMDQPYEYYVLELSSFQLDNMYRFRANIAVLLNITPDHLDRYGYNFQSYVDAKFRIVQNQTSEDDFIYYAGSEPIRAELAKGALPARQWPIHLEDHPSQGGCLRNDTLKVTSHGQVFEQSLAELPLPGTHNAINAMAAILVAQSVGLTPDQIRDGLRSFQNAPHRLETIATFEGVRYVNDSKATNVDSVFYALGSFDQPLILIAGGVDKGNDYQQIAELVRTKVKGFIALGKDNTKLTRYFAPLVPQFFATDSIHEAVEKARSWSQAGDVVLLSPACASFDLFRNYEDRGEQFKTAVHRLIGT